MLGKGYWGYWGSVDKDAEKVQNACMMTLVDPNAFSLINNRTSCTVFVEDTKRCVIDGGVWRECPGGFQVADFVRTINEVAGRVFVSLRTSKLYRIISW